MAKKIRKEKKEQTKKKGKTEEFKVEASQTVSDVKSFIEKFRSAVQKKREGYKSYAQKFRKKK